jgi:hypothetical protein
MRQLALTIKCQAFVREDPRQSTMCWAAGSRRISVSKMLTVPGEWWQV